MVSPFGTDLVGEELPSKFPPCIPPGCDVITYWTAACRTHFSKLAL